jgi:hypothetical protein
VLASVAQLHLQQGRLAEAEREYREVLPRLERVAGRWHGLTLSCAYKLGAVRAQLGDLDEALVLIRQAVAGGWSWAATERHGVPTHVALREDPHLAALRGHPGFEELVAPDGGLAALDQARAAAGARQFPDALRYLRLAVERGFDNPDGLLRDPLLAPLHGQREFHEIVAGLAD